MGGSISTSSHGRYQGGYQVPVNPRARKHPIELICLGLPRTGTLSLCTALKQLGLANPYHFQTLFVQKREDAARWKKIFNYKFNPSRGGRTLKREDFDDIFFESMVVSDIPSLVFYEELLRAYPTANVILTIRDSPEEWAESFRATIQQKFKEIYEPKSFASRLRQSVVKSDMEIVCMEIQRRFIDELERNPVKFYEEWNRQIMRRVPADRLLVYNVNQGWDPLIRFLGWSAAGQRASAGPFPHVNGRENFPREFLPDEASISDAASTLTANSVGVSSLASDSTLVGSTGTRRHILRRSLRD